MGTGHGDGPTCIYDVVPCTGCSCDPSPLQTYYELLEDEEEEV